MFLYGMAPLSSGGAQIVRYASNTEYRNVETNEKGSLHEDEY